MKSISGPHAGTALQWLPSEHLKWAAWKARYPHGEVFSTDTGSKRSYSGSAYSGYEQNPETIFPVPSYRNDLPKQGKTAARADHICAKAGCHADCSFVSFPGINNHPPVSHSYEAHEREAQFDDRCFDF